MFYDSCSHEEAVKNIDNKEYTRALLLYAKSIFLEPQNAEWYKARADVFYRIGDIKSAVLNYKKALSINPSEENWQIRLSNALNVQVGPYYQSIEVIIEGNDILRRKKLFSCYKLSNECN